MEEIYIYIYMGINNLKKEEEVNNKNNIIIINNIKNQ